MLLACTDDGNGEDGGGKRQAIGTQVRSQSKGVFVSSIIPQIQGSSRETWQNRPEIRQNHLQDRVSVSYDSAIPEYSRHCSCRHLPAVDLRRYRIWNAIGARRSR